MLVGSGQFARMSVPGTRLFVCELSDLPSVEGRSAVQALDLVWFVLFDLEAEVDFPALTACTFALAVPVSAVHWGDLERLDVRGAGVAVLHVGGRCSCCFCFCFVVLSILFVCRWKTRRTMGQSPRTVNASRHPISATCVDPHHLFLKLWRLSRFHSNASHQLSWAQVDP